MSEKDYEFYKKFYDDNRIRLLQYENLRTHFREMIHNTLGKNYYNMGMDVYECDAEACRHITKKANQSWFSRLLEELF